MLEPSQSWLIVKGLGGRDKIKQGLVSAGAKVTELAVYQRKLPDLLAQKQIAIQNMNECYSFLGKREKEADSIFGKYNKEKIDYENEGNITKRLGYFYTLPDNSNMYIACEDWTKDSNIPDDFALVLNSSEHQDWLNNEAF